MVYQIDKPEIDMMKETSKFASFTIRHASFRDYFNWPLQDWNAMKDNLVFINEYYALFVDDKPIALSESDDELHIFLDLKLE